MIEQCNMDLDQSDMRSKGRYMQLQEMQLRFQKLQKQQCSYKRFSSNLFQC